jgi:hypothetical protein
MATYSSHLFTAHSTIYKHTYWGNFNDTKDTINKILIKNRNEFIHKYKIKSYSKPCKICYTGYLDHKEYYTDNFGRQIIIFSQHPSRDYDNTFTLIKPLYELDQITGIKIIETLKSKRLLKKTIYDKLPTDISLFIQTFI